MYDLSYLLASVVHLASCIGPGASMPVQMSKYQSNQRDKYFIEISDLY